MITVQTGVPRNFTGTTTKTVMCRGWKCRWEAAVEGTSPSAAKRRAEKVRTEHEAECDIVAACRAVQLALHASRQAPTA